MIVGGPDAQGVTSQDSKAALATPNVYAPTDRPTAISTSSVYGVRDQARILALISRAGVRALGKHMNDMDDGERRRGDTRTRLASAHA